MIRILKVLVVLAVLGFVALAGYAYFGDLSPEETEVTVPVTLDG
jgi:predicted negative regulator of RcsB-dependent stress response